ncbi:unnamed protein product, partial [Rotaria sordida]
KTYFEASLDAAHLRMIFKLAQIFPSGVGGGINTYVV